jgi:hypothetical protein
MDKNPTRLALILVMTILPLLVTMIVVSTQSSAQLTDFFPVSPTDQNEYWHQIATFNLAGFNGGYYTHNEQTALITESRFGVHGPFYILLIGILSKVTGWSYATPIFFNVLFLAFGFIIFCWFADLSLKQILLAGLALSFFPPVLTYLPTAMQESLHQMVGMIFALIFGFSLMQQEKMKNWHKMTALVFTGLAALSRPSWALMFFPLFALYSPKNLKGQLKGLLFSCLTMVLLVVFMGLFITQGNNTITFAAEQFSHGIRSGLTNLFGTLIENLKIFLYPTGLVQIIFRIEYMLALALSAILAIIFWKKDGGRTFKQKLNNENLRLLLFIFLTIAPIIFWSFTIYFIKNDFRFIAPYILLIIFLLLFQKKDALVLVFTIINILLIPAAAIPFSNPVSSNFIYSKDNLTQTKLIFDQSIHFEPDQANAWCNTILLPVTLYDERIALIPPGIGISYVLDSTGTDKISFPFKSKYLLLTSRQFKGLKDEEIQQLKFVANFPDSQLFVNRMAECS